ncbi:MAG TPA: glycerol-3-phosphate 1-O-acyltransferase PlsY [Candidatus Nitrosotenuis sp.]|jgi:glycerol-3-phosphate acyltransferase PlsY|nr:glycerol-3-phosphate 1-O-acyltransferase PlsY [Candidatus Nitrosotenuis sp.]
MQNIVYFLLFAYLLGSIPFGLLFVKMAGRGDIRNIGSGNIGTTNVLRTGSKWLALATLFADFFKGMIPLVIIKWVGAPVLDQVWVAGAAVIGHVFPIWLRFKGGKGVATALGTFIGIMPILGVAVAGIWVALAVLTRISSLSALVAFLSGPLLAYLLAAPDAIIGYCMGISLLIIWTHRSNIRRLSGGEEKRF